jgi:hypothetical protein
MILRKYRLGACSAAMLVGVTVSTLAATTREVGSGRTYATIQGAINAAVAGDIINVHAGNYTEVVGVNKSSLTIRANPGDFPSITGQIKVNANNCTIDGLEIKGWTGNNSGITEASYNSTIYSGLTVKNCVIHAGPATSKATYPINVNNCSGTMSCGIFARNHTKTTITNVEIYGCITGMYMMSCKSTDGTFANGTVIANVNIHDCASDGVDVLGQYITLQDSKIYDNLSADSTPAKYHSDGIQVINNTGTTGTKNTDGMGCAQHLRIWRNTFGNATQNIFLEGPNDGSTALWSSPYVITDVLIANNVCYTNPPGTNIHGMDPTTTTTKGINIGYADGCHLYNNTILNQTTGINTGKNTYVHNNILKDCTTALNVPNTQLPTGALDYNLYYKNNNAVRWGTNFFATIVAFSAAHPLQEMHAVAGDPKLGSMTTPILQSGSAALDKAVNLYASASSCDLDRVKNIRPSSGAWDTGAYTYSSAPAPPTNLAIVP